MQEEYRYLKKLISMKKAINKFIILLLVLSCTACFDLQENLFLKKDGSGTFSFIIDLSQVKSMMSMFSDLEKAFDEPEKNPETKKNDKKNISGNKLSDSFEKTRRRLLNSKGISNVKIIDDSSKYNFGISFDFKTITALNQALNILFEEDDTTQAEKQALTYFEFKDNTLIRLEALDSKSIIGKSSAVSSQKENALSNVFFDAEKLFGTATYTTNYEFQQKIDSVENKEAILSADMQKISLILHPFANSGDSTSKKQTIANIISLK